MVLALCWPWHGQQPTVILLLQSALRAAEAQFCLDLGFLRDTGHRLKNNYENKRLWWSLHKEEVKQEGLGRQGLLVTKEVCVGLVNSFLVL